MSESIAIIGGGAAGFFTAINTAELLPNATITLYEASNKVLAKVLVSGGGRCNVTNCISDPILLSKNYPRGEAFLEKVFHKFTSTDTVSWFQKRGVPIVTEDDGRMFPSSNSSESIYNCLTQYASKAGVTVLKNHRLTQLIKHDQGYQLNFKDTVVMADTVVLATGSTPAIYTMLEDFGLEIIKPLPSLFTFKAKEHTQVSLAGLSVTNATARIREIKNSQETGPLLITHWGYSGPAILRLSAWYARDLAKLNYNFTLLINWNSYDQDELISLMKENSVSRPKDKVISWKEHGLPKRLWNYLFEESGLKEYTNWSEVGKKGINKLAGLLTQYPIWITSKSTFKEEFVTAGGIELKQLDYNSFQLNDFPNLYAAGEILNIDAITGGFNFQAAWSGGYCISQNISKRT